MGQLGVFFGVPNKRASEAIKYQYHIFGAGVVERSKSWMDCTHPMIQMDWWGFGEHKPAISQHPRFSVLKDIASKSQVYSWNLICGLKQTWWYIYNININNIKSPKLWFGHDDRSPKGMTVSDQLQPTESSQQEARAHASQLRGHRQLYEVKGAHRVLLVGEGGERYEKTGWPVENIVFHSECNPFFLNGNGPLYPTKWFAENQNFNHFHQFHGLTLSRFFFFSFFRTYYEHARTWQRKK